MSFTLARRVLLAAVAVLGLAVPAQAAEWFVVPGGVGTGSGSFPFGRIQDALNAAHGGDLITVAPGTYAETLRSVRDGAPGAPITLRAAQPRTAIVSRAGRVLTVGHAYLVVDGFVLDGEYGADDTVRVTGDGDFLELRNTEVRRSSRDLIDMGSPEGVLIDGCLIHHALNPVNGRSDAHGVVGASVRHLTIRDTEIHTFSGDGVQFDPDRAAPGWDDVTVERTKIWLEPLPAPENGFAAGVVPGENAIDTKQAATNLRSRLVIRDTVASGFRGGLITNMAAFNLKEYVDVTLDGVTVFDSEIAFRLRGPGPTGAHVAVKNAVVHDVLTAFRYEDNIQNLRIWNSTVGLNVTRVFQNASAPRASLDVRNLLTLQALPDGFGPSNLVVSVTSFVDAAARDYRLAAGSPAVDAGERLTDVAIDRDGVERPQGGAYDVGAYEAPVAAARARRAR